MTGNNLTPRDVLSPSMRPVRNRKHTHFECPLGDVDYRTYGPGINDRIPIIPCRFCNRLIDRLANDVSRGIR